MLGHTIEFLKNPLKWAQKRYHQYGPVVKINTLGMKAVIVFGPEPSQKVLLDMGGDFSSRMGFVDCSNGTIYMFPLHCWAQRSTKALSISCGIGFQSTTLT